MTKSVLENPGSSSDDNVFHPRGYPLVTFTSPSENITCGMSAGSTVCHVSAGPALDALRAELGSCGSTEARYDGVQLKQGRAYGVCNDELGLHPGMNDNYGQQTAWFRLTGWFPAGENGDVADIPYGKAVEANGYRCASTRAGITCTELATGHTMSLSSQTVRVTGTSILRTT